MKKVTFTGTGGVRTVHRDGQYLGQIEFRGTHWHASQALHCALIEHTDVFDSTIGSTLCWPGRFTAEAQIAEALNEDEQ